MVYFNFNSNSNFFIFSSLSGGYYSVQVKPGLRVMALNTNYCTRLNPWTLYDPVDPGQQLKWLVNELYEAESSK